MKFSSDDGRTDDNSLRCQLMGSLFADFVVLCCVMFISAVRWFSASFVGLPPEVVRSIPSPVSNFLRVWYTVERETVIDISWMASWYQSGVIAEYRGVVFHDLF